MKHKIINIILTLIFLSGCEFSDENKEGEKMANLQYYIDDLDVIVLEPQLNVKTYGDQFIIDCVFSALITKGDADIDNTIPLKQNVVIHKPLTLQSDKIKIKNIIKNQSFTFEQGSNKIITQSGQTNLFADIPLKRYFKIGAGASFPTSVELIQFFNNVDKDINRYSSYIPVDVYQDNYIVDTILNNSGISGGFDLMFYFTLSDLYANSLFTRTQAGIYPVTAFELTAFSIQFQIIGELVR